MDTFDRAVALLRDGGAVMWPLAGAAALAWYALGYRFFMLGPGAVKRARRVAGDAARGAPKDELQVRVSLATGPHLDRLGRFRVPLAAIVIAAPLLGLLGTVGGMMHTFGALGEGALHAQGGGIARGISEALLTTQLGLAVAIPGLVLGRLLARREVALRDRIDAEARALVARRLAEHER